MNTLRTRVDDLQRVVLAGTSISVSMGSGGRRNLIAHLTLASYVYFKSGRIISSARVANAGRGEIAKCGYRSAAC
jgi:hypothetical protein